MQTKHLLNIGVLVHFLESIAIDLAKVDFEWIVRFKLGNLLLKWAKKDRTCVVCLDQEREVVLDPCRHYCLCRQCSDNLITCPMCRRRIEDVVDFTEVIRNDQSYFLSIELEDVGKTLLAKLHALC